MVGVIVGVIDLVGVIVGLIDDGGVIDWVIVGKGKFTSFPQP